MTKATEVKEDIWIRTNCGGCYASCPIRVHRVNGVAVKIEGEPDWPAAPGAVCGKGLGQLQTLYDPNRVNYPLKRTNPEKGIGVDPGWVRISWQEALDIITEKLKALEDPEELITFHTPTTGGICVHQQIFAHSMGGCTQSGGGGMWCGNTTHLLGGQVHGAWSVTADFERCNYVIYLGTGKGHSSGHSSAHMMRAAADAKSRGMKMVVFDPVANFAGGKAREWIPIIPGTDGAVLLAMINVILNELGICDTEYIKTTTNGPFLIRPDGHYARDKETGKPLVFDAVDNNVKLWDDPGVKDYALEGKCLVDGIECQPAFQIIKESVRKYTPKMAEEISTVPEATIRRIATEFAQAASVGSTVTIQGKTLPLRPAAVIAFRGLNGHTNSFNTLMAVYLINAIVGANDVPGGAVGWPSLFHGLPTTGYPEWMPWADPKDGALHTGWWFPEPFHKMWPVPDPKLPVSKVVGRDLFPLAMISPFLFSADRHDWRAKTGPTKQLKVAICWAANFILSEPDPPEIARSLKEIPFIAAFRLFLDEFTDFCDVVLPDTHPLETLFPGDHLEIGFCGPPAMTDWYFCIKQPVVERQFERRQSMEVYMELAQRMGPVTFGRMCEEFNRYYRMRDPFRLKTDGTTIYTFQEVVDHALKSWAGEDHGLGWFKEHNTLRWPKKVEEAYFRPFVKNLRQFIYLEYVLGIKEKAMALSKPKGIEVDWRHYSPVPEYFPCPPHEVKDPAYDLYAVTYRDILHTGSTSLEVPWIIECSEANPFTLNIQLNSETARKKGLNDGDVVWVESSHGYRQKGRLKLMEGIHPQVVGFCACAGHWAKGMPIALGKGTNFNSLMRLTIKDVDPVTMSLEASLKVKIYRAEED